MAALAGAYVRNHGRYTLEFEGGGGGIDVVDWLPVDVAAQAIVECTPSNVERSEMHSLDVFHIINPKTSFWRDMVPVIQEFVAENREEWWNL